MSYDLVVIGTGPGGYVCAIRAAQLGLKTAVVEKRKTHGGTCLNIGCIPSKALLQSSEYFEHAGRHFKDHGIQVQGLGLDLAKMLARKDTVVKQNNDGIMYLFKKNKIAFFHGRGSFAGRGDAGYEIAVAGASSMRTQTLPSKRRAGLELSSWMIVRIASEAALRERSISGSRSRWCCSP